MSEEDDFKLGVVCELNALEWYPTDEDIFYEPQELSDAEKVGKFLHFLPDGTCLPMRGRDWQSVDTFTPWSYGVAIKNGSRLFFLYESGDIESFLVCGVNYLELVHFIFPRPRARFSLPLPDSDHVVVISHGWSEIAGPDYPFIRTLQSVAASMKWKVIIPDFRPSYRYDADFTSRRGRAERVKLIYEELLCLDPKPSHLVLVGHSQGGAASSLACTDRVVQSCNVKGLLLFGSECPLSLDSMNWVPKPPKGLIVHAEGDRVISIGEMEETARRWDFEFKALKSTVASGQRDCWGDDINHDFTAKDLIIQATAIFREFLQSVW